MTQGWQHVLGHRSHTSFKYRDAENQRKKMCLQRFEYAHKNDTGHSCSAQWQNNQGWVWYSWPKILYYNSLLFSHTVIWIYWQTLIRLENKNWDNASSLNFCLSFSILKMLQFLHESVQCLWLTVIKSIASKYNRGLWNKMAMQWHIKCHSQYGKTSSWSFSHGAHLYPHLQYKKPNILSMFINYFPWQLLKSVVCF